jgi:hypothetical protein
VDLINSAFEWVEENNPEYLNAIANRKSGSQWGGGFNWREIVDCYWQIDEREIPLVHQPSCTYLNLNLFQYRHPSFLDGYENIRLLSSLSREELNLVQLCEGGHGLELRAEFVEPRKAKVVQLIIGNAYKDGEKVEGHKMPWACYPGQLTASIKHIPQSWNWNGTLLDLWAISREKSIPFAVKGVNFD